MPVDIPCALCDQPEDAHPAYAAMWGRHHYREGDPGPLTTIEAGTAVPWADRRAARETATAAGAPGYPVVQDTPRPVWPDPPPEPTPPFARETTPTEPISPPWWRRILGSST